MSVCLFGRVLASAINLAKRAGKIAREVRLSNDLQIIEKGKQDFQTEADRKSQELIIGSLTHLFPNLRFIGEEGDLALNYFEDVGGDAEALAANYPASLTALQETEVVCWVDPLDGTKEYTEGGEWIEHVTVLIGFSVNGSAVGGVIHQPFYKFSENKDTTGRTIWGAVGLGAFGLDTESADAIRKERESKCPVYTATRSHSSPIVNECFESLQPCEVLRLGGSGHKVLAVLDGKVDAYVYPSLGLKRWDSCAPEAVLRAAGGYFTDIEGNSYIYNPDDPDTMNWMGALAGFGSPKELADKIPKTIVQKVMDVRDKKKAAVSK